jgi:hypothetical protein
MTMNSRRVARVVGAGLVGLALVGMPSGCASGGGSSDMVSKAMSALPSGIKDSVNRYVGNLTDLNRTLAGITNADQARSASPRVGQLVDSLNSDAGTINNAPSDVRRNVKTAFPQLGDLTKNMTSQVQRLMGNKDISSVLKPVLDRLPKLSL